jgi:hypothetical protein
MRVLKAGQNNFIENFFSLFCWVRKICLFTGVSVGGAFITHIFSLFETAKASSLEPYSYL